MHLHTNLRRWRQGSAAGLAEKLPSMGVDRREAFGGSNSRSDTADIELEETSNESYEYFIHEQAATVPLSAQSWHWNRLNGSRHACARIRSDRRLLRSSDSSHCELLYRSSLEGTGISPTA